MKICKNCGKENQDECNECSHCGSSLKTYEITEDYKKYLEASKREKSAIKIFVEVVLAFIVIAIFISVKINIDRNNKKEKQSNTQVEENSNIEAIANSDEYDYTETEEYYYEDEITESQRPLVSFENKVMYDKNKIKITLLSGNQDELEIMIENNSKKDYSANIHAMAINGVMTNCNIYTGDFDIPSNKKTKDTIYIDSEWIKNEDEAIDYIDLMFWFYNENFKEFETEIIRIQSSHYTEDYKVPKYENSESKKGLNVSLLNKDLSELDFAISNTSDNIYYVDFDNFSINEWSFELDVWENDFLDLIIFPNTVLYNPIKISDNFIESNNIETIDNIEFNVEAQINDNIFDKLKMKHIKFK